MKGKNSRQSSGQVLVIAVLVVSLVLLSTQVYIYEVGKTLEGIESVHVNDFVLAVKIGSIHAVTGSLANVSAGGKESILFENLERWITFTENLYQFGKPILNFALRNTLPYTNGTYLSWGNDGFGVSSAYADFNFSLSDRQFDVHMSYTANVTTSLIVKGVCRSLDLLTRQINITCDVLNEANSGLAKNITMLYTKFGFWQRADSMDGYSYTDYGNGTYQISFEDTFLPLEIINISAQIYDLREIYVQTNATCTDIT